MAREKDGLDYFPLDVYFNDAMNLIKAEFGLKGVGLYVSLLQKIYGGRGYYAPWNKDVELMFASANGVGVGFVSEVLNALLRRGIFDSNLYEQYGVLTSDGIQKRYVEAAARRVSKKIDGRYLLIPAPKNWVIVNINAENADRNAENACSFAQRKGNTTTTCYGMVSASGSEDFPQAVENSPPTPPTLTEIRLYMQTHTQLDDDEAQVEAVGFFAHNTKRNWDCLPCWQEYVDVWVSKMRR